MADQLSNFLMKFRHEWQAGTDARLVLECHAGKAWINIHQPLGHPPPPPPKPHPRRPGPSRLRRRARREDARAAARAAPREPLAATAEVAVQTHFSPDKSDAAVQANVSLAPTMESPAAQAGSRAEHPQHHAHHVPDALCPDIVYQSPAVQAVPPLGGDVPHTHPPIPQLDGQQDHVWSCKCCTYETFFDTEQELQQHHDGEHGDFLMYEECNICYPWHVWVDVPRGAANHSKPTECNTS